jgi:hypothetical protein
VRAHFVTQLAEKWGLVLWRKHHQNIGGVSDDTSDLNNLFDVLSRPHIAQTLFEVFLRIATTRAAFEVNHAWISLRTRFTTLLEIVYDGQRMADVSCLGEPP